jgi:thiamine phosphate synthase YjbQ (UPF0047 family)
MRPTQSPEHNRTDQQRHHIKLSWSFPCQCCPCKHGKLNGSGWRFIFLGNKHDVQMRSTVPVRGHVQTA